MALRRYINKVLPVPRRKTHLENRRQWPRVAIKPELFDSMAIFLANRRLPLSEAHILIEQALKDAYPGEYEAALATLAKFNHADDMPPE